MMKRKTKLNLELLKEEQKRFRLLSEYDFYQEEKTEPEYEKPLLLGDLEEADETPSDDNTPEDSNNQNNDAAADIESQLDVDNNEDIPDEPVGDLSEPENDTEEPIDDMETDVDMGVDTDIPAEEPATDEVEVDVTSLVQGSEEAKEAADRASQNSEELLQKLSDLENRIARMDAISSKIEDLEKEIVKRNPTPIEKLEMRSLNSFPYTQKLSDYWKDKTGQYDVMDKEKDEYVLTKDDVDYGYSEPQIKQSFNVSPDDYEEEEI